MSTGPGIIRGEGTVEPPPPPRRPSPGGGEVRRLTALALTILADIAQALIAAKATISEQDAEIERLRAGADWAWTIIAKKPGFEAVAERWLDEFYYPMLRWPDD